MSITSTPQWGKLAELSETKKSLNLRELFTADPNRADSLTFDAAGLHVDLSKNLVDAELIDALVALADAAPKDLGHGQQHLRVWVDGGGVTWRHECDMFVVPRNGS